VRQPRTTARRRRARPPWWQDLEQSQLHALAGRLRRDMFECGISERQDWLLGRLLEELELRRQERPPSEQCSCDLCCSPFPTDGHPTEAGGG